MYSAATTVDEYLDELSEDRRAAIEGMRKIILDNLLGGLRGDHAVRDDRVRDSHWRGIR